MPLVTTSSLWLEYLWLVPLVAVFVILLRVFFSWWNLYVTYRYQSKLNWVLLEISTPELAGTTPKAMEQLLSGLHGMVKFPNLIETYIEGFVAHRFSLEIVGKDGDVRFLIRVQKVYEDLARSQVYAQYPDAEIKEVSDYAWEVPDNIPNEKWNLWGTELMMTKKKTVSGAPAYVYPIRTHPYFKDDVAEEKMIDPIASVVEVFNHLKKGEQLWVQILCEATHDEWDKESEKEVNAILGRKGEEKKPDIFDKGQKLLRDAAWKPGALMGMAMPEEKKDDEQGAPSLMQHISPGERVTVEAIEAKAGKLGFHSKIRFLYIGKREVFNMSRIPMFLGAWKQFATQDWNGFMPDKRFTTKINFFMVNSREARLKKRITMRYRYRAFSGMDPYILNIEELATMYHFPTGYVKAPATPRVKSKKAVAPTNLPI
jgi:hypothetical protein